MPFLRDEATVVYDRNLCEETYELRHEGVKQSFVFNRLPEGSGDLVIRMRAAANAPGTPEPDGIRFGGVTGPFLRIGGVLAYDARGDDVPSTIEFDQEGFVIRVDDSALTEPLLPLVVDPLISGPVGTPVSPGYFGQTFDIAANAPSQRYCIAWNECTNFYSSGPSLISWARYFDPITASFSGFQLRLGNGGGTRDLLPQIAHVSGSGYFVTVSPMGLMLPMTPYYWASVNGSVLKGDSGTGEIRPGFWPAPGDLVEVVDIGGTTDGAGNAATVAYTVITDPALPVARVDQFLVDAAGAATYARTVTLGSVDLGAGISISKSDGIGQRHLVAWRYQGQLQCAVVDRSMQLLYRGPVGPGGTTGSRIEVAGDGRHWLLTYLSPTGELVFRSAQWTSTAQTLRFGREHVLGTVTPPQPDACLRGALETPVASVAFMDGSFLIGYLDGGDNAQLVSVDPFNCAPCEGPFLVQSHSPRTARTPTAVGRLPASGGSEQALVVANERTIRLFRSDDGVVEQVGGGCGRGGWATAACVRNGNNGFALRLRDGRPQRVVAALVAAQSAAFACGPCVVHVDTSTAVASPATTDSDGNALLPLAIPPNPVLVGQSLYLQWAVTGGAACASGLDLSTAIKITIQ